MKQYAFVWQNGVLHKVVFSNVIYIEGAGDYIKIFSYGDFSPVTTHLGLHAIEEKFPSEIFLRVHRSFIVNVDRISKITGNEISFENSDYKIYAGEKYKSILLGKINYIRSKWLAKKEIENAGT